MKKIKQYIIDEIRSRKACIKLEPKNLYSYEERIEIQLMLDYIFPTSTYPYNKFVFENNSYYVHSSKIDHLNFSLTITDTSVKKVIVYKYKDIYEEEVIGEEKDFLLEKGFAIKPSYLLQERELEDLKHIGGILIGDLINNNLEYLLGRSNCAFIVLKGDKIWATEKNTNYNLISKKKI